ncbi:unnamed protein product [Hydatigera taeniaeformis]|uniref:Transposase n=1 Tax=Hydatigena taeniaeformis TaxID=6205 RepID=A0A0R3WWC8_HYDTA|nr:unnamed protein product [Hydatigera taeniaeformis]
MLCVRNDVTDKVLQKHLKHTSEFLVDQSRDALHSATARKTSNGGFRDTLDVVTQYLPVTIRASFTQAFSTFASTGHRSIRYVQSAVNNGHQPTKKQRGHLR